MLRYSARIRSLFWVLLTFRIRLLVHPIYHVQDEVWEMNALNLSGTVRFNDQLKFRWKSNPSILAIGYPRP